MRSSDAGWFAVGAAVGAVAGSVLRWRVFADKILIVTDGSVDLKAVNSRVGDKGAHKPKKHKWDTKAAALSIAYGRSKDTACGQAIAWVPFAAIGRVELQIRDEQLSQILTTVVVRNEQDGRLYLEMEDNWEFKGGKTSRQLYGPSGPAAGRLGSVTVYFADADFPPLTFPAAAGIHVCAQFRD